ncbi:universal stress protein [Rhodococcus coprophilus]|uniref:Usp family protein n=1 Tax=Rhodococcus coprophilus TaxID=38310 RepID=A0A2X4UWP3_9NOCA|nr:universal stress protein [Rhodococcus coprophilus]MBM7460321.1 nucleotide-binding universal stress UspA family protein [Rhodococcus coprophilus]SQI39082.1 Usp family protein [Rhodococcus coprophilus]
MSTGTPGGGILVGIDGSDSAVDAARWAAVVARRLGEPLRLVHAHSGGPGDADEPTRAVLDNAEAAILEEAAAVDAAAPREPTAGNELTAELAVEKKAVSGRPANALSDLSASARMLVLGHTTTSELQSMFRRSDVVYVANHAVCPVVSWRSEQGFRPPDGRPIVVGVDGTQLSSAAIGEGYRLAAALEAPLVAVHTWVEHSTITYGEDSRFTDWTDFAAFRKARMVESMADWASDFPDVEVEHRVERGKPDIVLLEHSAHAQLIVVGSHGRSAQSSAILGSTSQGLIHHSFCPVAICRAR